jgi:hypothetical protein
MVVIQDLTVLFEPCSAYAPDPSAGACSDCGWLEEDH